MQGLESEKEEAELRVTELTAAVQRAKGDNDKLEKAWKDRYRELELTVNTAPQPRSSQEDVSQVKRRVAQLERELREATAAKSRVEEDCKDLKRQLAAAANSDFSDPANLILTEQVRTLEAKLEELESAAETEKADLRAKVEHLEQHLERAKKQSKQKVETPVLQQPQESYNRDAEKRYVEAKMSLANAEMEKEVLAQKYKEAQEKLRQYSQQYTELEVEFYKVNERFGMTINAQNELEMEIQTLRAQVGKKGK